MQRRIAVLAVLAGLMALPLFAQSPLLDQGRAAMARNDAETAAALFETLKRVS